MTISATLLFMAGLLAWGVLILAAWLRLLMVTGARTDMVQAWKGESIAYAVKFNHPLPRLLAYLRGDRADVVTIARLVFVGSDHLAAYDHAFAFAGVMQDHKAMLRGAHLNLFTDLYEIARLHAGPRYWRERDAMLFAATYQHAFASLAAPIPPASEETP